MTKIKPLNFVVEYEVRTRILNPLYIDFSLLRVKDVSFSKAKVVELCRRCVVNITLKVREHPLTAFGLWVC